MATSQVPTLRTSRVGFSLLEIIIATAILAASGVMLMSMFATADRHGRRAEERAIGQMLCQSKLDELVANPAQILPIEAEYFRQYPGWTYSVALEPTAMKNFARLTVAVSHIPGTEVGADLELASRSTESPANVVSPDQLPQEPTYQLVRWLQFEGDLTGLGMGSSSTGIPGTAEY